MTTLYEIPTGPSARIMSVTLGAKTYGLRLAYADAPEAGWFVDIADAQGNALIAGLPLVPGGDILQPYPDLGIAVKLYVESDPDAGPLTYDALGVSWHLVYALD